MSRKRKPHTLHSALEDMLRTGHKLRVDDVRPGCTYEVEARIGVVRKPGSNVRLLQGEDRGKKSYFDSNVNPWYFFAIFQEFSVDPDISVGEPVRDETEHFEQEPGIRREHPGGEEGRHSAPRWVKKAKFADAANISQAQQNWWFDVRVAGSVESRIGEPASIREARAYGRRVKHPFQHARSRQGFPSILRRRIRRSLRFRSHPGWRLDFTCVSTSKMTSVPHPIKSRSSEYTFRIGPELCELELEWEQQQCTDPVEAATHGCAILEWIKSVLGQGEKHIHEHIDRARCRFSDTRLEQIVREGGPITPERLRTIPSPSHATINGKDVHVHDVLATIAAANAKA